MGGSNFKTFALFLVLLGTSCTDGHRYNLTHQKQITKRAGNILQALGYASKCVAATLATCSHKVNDKLNETHFLENVVQNINIIDNHLQNINVVLADIKKEVSKVQNINNIGNHSQNIDVVFSQAQKPRSWHCEDLRKHGDLQSGSRIVYPYKCCPSHPMTVYCDQETDEGGWTVIQRRDDLPVRENFYRSWSDYVLGFGNITGEFWLGLDHIFALTNYKVMEVRFDLEDFEGQKRFAKYKTFRIEDSSTDYVLHIGRYEGDAGDSMEYHDGKKFSTWDNDNDVDSRLNCAKDYKGAFWHGKCGYANINGFPHKGKYTSSYPDGIVFNHRQGYYYSLKKVEMKIKPAY